MASEMPKYEWARTREIVAMGGRSEPLTPPDGEGWTLASELLSGDLLVCIWCRVKP